METLEGTWGVLLTHCQVNRIGSSWWLLVYFREILFNLSFPGAFCWLLCCPIILIGCFILIEALSWPLLAVSYFAGTVNSLVHHSMVIHSWAALSKAYHLAVWCLPTTIWGENDPCFLHLTKKHKETSCFASISFARLCLSSSLS